MFIPLDLLAAHIAAPLYALWVVLATHVRRDHLDAFPSRKTIGHALGGVDPATVSRLVSRLEAAGWLHVNRLRANRYSRNYYRPGGTITAGGRHQYAAVGRDELDALKDGAINASAFRALARWYFLMGPRAGWTRDTLEDYAAAYGTSVRTARRDRSALVAAGLLEVDDPKNPTTTARPGHLPAARSNTQQTPAKIVTPARPKSSPQPGQNRHTEVVTDEVVTDEVDACGPGRRPRLGSNARAAATTAPPAPRAEERDKPNPAPVVELVDTDHRDGRTEQEARNAAGVLLRRFPAGYQQQQERYLRATFRRLARVLAYGYGPDALPLGPEAILTAVNRHDRPEHNPTQTLELALRELAADVHAGACPECGRDPDALRPICDRCNPDRDTLTAAELAALAAAGYDLEATA